MGDSRTRPRTVPRTSIPRGRGTSHAGGLCCLPGGTWGRWTGGGLLRHPHRHPKPRSRRHDLRDGILLGFLLVTVTGVCVSSIVLMGSAKSRSPLLLLRRHLGTWSPSSGGPRTQEGRPGGGLWYRGGVFAGVITSGRSMQRAEVVRTTWGRAVANLTFFTDEPSMETVGASPDMSLVKMVMDAPRGEAGIYQKTYHALRHICASQDFDWRRFDWFFIARDDIFVNVKNMMAMIRTLEPAGKIQAGVVSRHSEKKDAPLVCLSTPGLLLSRQLFQGACGYLDQCQREAQRYDPDIGLSSCIYLHSGVPCTPLPQAGFHRITEDEIRSLVLAEPDYTTAFTRRLDHVTVTYGAPQPWLLQQLHIFTLQSRFRVMNKKLEVLIESKTTMESDLYATYSGSLQGSSISADTIHSREGESYSSQTCEGFTWNTPRFDQLIESAGFLLQSTRTIPTEAYNFSVVQLYSANLANRTMATLVDLKISSSDDQSHLNDLARVVLRRRHQPLRLSNQKTVDKLNQIWILLPVSNTTELVSFLDFWRELREIRLGSAMYLLILPIRLSSAQVARAVPKEGIYSSKGEVRKLISFPKDFTTEKQAFSEGTAHACKGHQDAAFLLMQTTFRFRLEFLRRCLAVASSGSQYFPIPYRRQIFSETFSVARSDDSTEQDTFTFTGDRNHTVWMDKKSFLQCFSSKYCSDVGNISSHTIMSSDPDLFWFDSQENQHRDVEPDTET